MDYSIKRLLETKEKSMTEMKAIVSVFPDAVLTKEPSYGEMYKSSMVDQAEEVEAEFVYQANRTFLMHLYAWVKVRKAEPVKVFYSRTFEIQVCDIERILNGQLNRKVLIGSYLSKKAA